MADNPPRVELQGLAGVASLIGADNDSAVEPSGTTHVLVGYFSLRIDALGKRFDSKPVLFGPSGTVGRVVSGGESWRLGELRRQAFTFSPQIELAGSPRCPRLVASRLLLVQLAGDGLPPLLSVEDLALSLVPTAQPGAARTVRFPTAAGVDEHALLRLAHPAIRRSRGYYLRPDANGTIGIHVGGADGGMVMDHAGVVDLTATDGCQLVFRLRDRVGADDGCLAFEPRATGALSIGVQHAAGLTLDPDSSFAGTFANLDRAVARGGFLSTDAFHAPEISVARVGSDGAGAGTMLFGRRECFAFELEIPEEGPFDPAGHIAEIRYEDPSLTAGGAAQQRDLRDRFYGLLIKGLASVRGRQEILDASLATVRLTAGEGGFLFEFEAGGQVHRRGQCTHSLLVPKTDTRQGGSRRLGIPLGVLDLETADISAGLSPETPSPIRYRSADTSLVLNNPVLSGPPLGLSAGEDARAVPGHAVAALNLHGQRASEFRRWQLERREGDTDLILIADEAGVRVKDPKWSESFVSRPDTFALLERPGTKIAIDQTVDIPPVGLARATGTAGVEVEYTVVSETEDLTTGEKLLAYSALIAGLSLYAFRKPLMKASEAYLPDDDLKIKYTKLGDDAFRKYAKKNGLNDVLVTFFAPSAGDPAEAQLERFIDDNTPDGPEVKLLKWPLAMGLSMVMFDERDGAHRRYLFELSRARDPAAKPGLAFDLSAVSAVEPGYLGWTNGDWRSMGERDPMLWPRLADTASGRSDPSDAQWVGVMMRDIPVEFVTDPQVDDFITKHPNGALARLYKAINSALMLRYGWKDSSGATWYVTLANAVGYDFTPKGWESFMRFELDNLVLTGASGKTAGGSGELTCTLERIRNDEDLPLAVRGRFGIDVTNTDPIGMFELAVENADLLETNSVPGFEKVRVKGLTSDLKRIAVTLELHASAGLGAALPVFSTEHPVLASLVMNLSGPPDQRIQISIPTDRETNLFGKFPFTLQGVYLELGEARNRFLVRGCINLGVVGFESIGADLVALQTDSGWEFDVYVNEIDANFAIGDFKIQGLLSWAPDHVPMEKLRDPCGFHEPLPGNALTEVGEKRNFWGILGFRSGKLMGDNHLLLKIGTRGELTYWIGAAVLDRTIPLGSAELQRPALLVARNADFGGNLRKMLVNPFSCIANAVRPPAGTLEEKRAWLAQWKPSADIGTLIAGSGYFHMDERIAASPADEDAPAAPKYLTSILVTDSGLFRVDGQAKFLYSAIIGFTAAINTRDQHILVGFRTPKLGGPDPKQPKYLVYPGQLYMGIGYGTEPSFLLSIGWPDLARGSDIERDWSKATKVYVADMFPINTFWGGYRALVEKVTVGGHGRWHIRFGYALRAGWTRSYEFSGANIARASAELGVALGGVIEFEINWNELTEARAGLSDRLPVLESLDRNVSRLMRASLAEADQLLVETVEQSIELMRGALSAESYDVVMSAAVYGDAWGQGSAEFLGVTLATINIALRLRIHFCGSLRRGVTRAHGRGEIELKVTVMCIDYYGYAGFDLWLVRGACLGPLQSGPLMTSGPTLLESLLERLERGTAAEGECADE
ncbi:hypothetical protein [Halomonas daqiaonensis]|uniref:Uncharacterized protein n=1 Tax=Halomonas daqiaonensis TaxID=650850 RepID=A0A1H7P304_9GAMM|nr:hypothetical protein [Halomonas daqiaonensis]SEL29605.1 hypothetical protein SAMN04488129_108158 [Halomonas daqiaonensis]